MKYKITHTTEYNYHEPVSLCHNIARLVPRSTNQQQCTNVDIIIRPQPDVWNEYEDFFGNKVIYFAIEQEHKKLTVSVTSSIEKPVDDKEAWEEKDSMPWEEVRNQLLDTTGGYLDVRQFIPETGMTAVTNEIAQYALQSFTPGQSLAAAVQQLNTRIYQDFEFKPGFTTIATPLSTVMKQRKGVCQDFAHLAMPAGM
jgi:transglutaminase-like putative cysteine protease